MEGKSLVTLQMQSEVIASAETPIAVTAFERLGSSVFPESYQIGESESESVFPVNYQVGEIV